MLGANVSLMRALPMPYVESLRVFVRIVELGSITSGGRDLRLTPAVASKRIKELERHLGVRLFNRTTRSLTPTEVGRVFYDHARQALAALDEAEAVVANFSDTPRGVIRVTAPLVTGRRIIAPLVPESPISIRNARCRCGCPTGRWTCWASGSTWRFLSAFRRSRG